MGVALLAMGAFSWPVVTRFAPLDSLPSGDVSGRLWAALGPIFGAAVLGSVVMFVFAPGMEPVMPL